MKNTSLKQFTLLILILFSAFIYFNCDDSGIVTQEKKPFTIEAQIINYTPFGLKIVFANILSVTGSVYYICYCSIDNEGKFIIVPPDIKDTTVMPVESFFFRECTGGNASFNPSDAKGAPIYNFDVSYNSNIVGKVDFDNYSSQDTIRKTSDFDVMYIFMDRKVTGTGFRLKGNDTVKIDCSLEQGWNKIIRHYSRVDSANKTILFDLTEPSGAVWEYYAN
jgi:hypothetical protein